MSTNSKSEQFHQNEDMCFEIEKSRHLEKRVSEKSLREKEVRNLEFRTAS
jgi:hypothetical protein